MQYKVCPDCGAHLDFGERCDCTEKEAAPLPQERPQKNVATTSLSAGQLNVKPDRERVAYG